MTTTITIKMTPQDFDLLSDMQMEYAGNDWIPQLNEGRFEDKEIAILAQTMQWIYWFDNPLNLILAKSYLASNKLGFHTTYDCYSESWVIFTNYATRVDA
jgi:hypothetical protein